MALLAGSSSTCESAVVPLSCDDSAAINASSLVLIAMSMAMRVVGEVVDKVVEFKVVESVGMIDGETVEIEGESVGANDGFAVSMLH